MLSFLLNAALQRMHATSKTMSDRWRDKTKSHVPLLILMKFVHLKAGHSQSSTVTVLLLHCMLFIQVERAEAADMKKVYQCIKSWISKDKLLCCNDFQ